MNNQMWRRGLLAAAFSAVIAFAGMGCIASAFALEPVRLEVVALALVAVSAAFALCFTLPAGKWILLGACAVLVGYILLAEPGEDLLQLEAMLYKISKAYDGGYDWGIIRWSDAPLLQIPKTGGLILLGTAISGVICHSVCKGKWPAAAVVGGFLPLAACYVVTDTVPDSVWVWVLFVALGLLVIPFGVGRRDFREGLKLTAASAIPVILAISLLFQVFPRSRYSVQISQMQSQIWGWLQGTPFFADDGEVPYVPEGVAAQVDLSAVGPQRPQTYAVMDVRVDTGGRLYLREQSLDSYDGKSWETSVYSTGIDRFFPTVRMISRGQVQIYTAIQEKALFVPYYTAMHQQLQYGRTLNLEQQREYSYTRFDFYGGYGHVENRENAMSDPMIQQCLQLPVETRNLAEDLAARILEENPVDRFNGIEFSASLTWTDTTKDTVEVLTKYVKQSAEYSLNTGRMPAGEQDFALWFLQDSDTGYCVHFATALAVLLRASGIPARYVEGYAVDIPSGEKITVYENSRHAWVEYFHPDSGWIVADATPEIVSDEELPTQPTEAETQAPTIYQEPVTQPTLPTEATEAPTEDTQVQTQEDSGGNWPAVGICAGGIVVAAVVQAALRKYLRSRKMRRGTANKQALARWQTVKRLAGLTEQLLPELPKNLAEKAKFSQHTLTQVELEVFDTWITQAEALLREKRWYQRLAIWLIWAI